MNDDAKHARPGSQEHPSGAVADAQASREAQATRNLTQDERENPDSAAEQPQRDGARTGDASERT